MISGWRRTLAVAVAIATFAAAPMLVAPWDEDEVFLVGAVSGTSPWMNTRFDAYRFSSGDPAEVASRVTKGIFPWYTAPDFKYALFRPLTSALLWLDALLFGDARLGYQLHALAWHAALVVAAALVLRRVVPGRIGQAALLLFAASVVHTTPTGWLTARHVLVGIAPVVFGLISHLRWREDGVRVGLPLSIVLYAAGLLGSEAAAQGLAYVVAYEVCRRGVPLAKRLLGLLPVLGVVSAYAALYSWLGRGHAYGSPLASLRGLVTVGLPRLFAHAAVLLGVSVRPDNPWGYDALRATMLVVVPLVLLAPVAIRGLSEGERRAVIWLALGAALALVPVMGTPLESRVLLAPSLGAAAVVAAVLAEGVAQLRDRDRSGSPLGRALVVGGAACVASVHVVLASMELPQHYLAMARERDRRLGVFLRATRPDESDVELLVVGAPHFLFGQLGGYLRERTVGARSRAWVPLADANCAHRLVRTGVDRVEIEPRCVEGFFPYGRLEAGDEVKQRDWTVRVVEGHPHGRFEVRFSKALEEASVAFVTFDGFADRRVVLPAVGEAVELPEPAPAALYAIDAPSQWLHAHF